jgi:hypothetical protein
MNWEIRFIPIAEITKENAFLFCLLVAVVAVIFYLLFDSSGKNKDAPQTQVIELEPLKPRPNPAEHFLDALELFGKILVVCLKGVWLLVTFLFKAHIPF